MLFLKYQSKGCLLFLNIHGKKKKKHKTVSLKKKKSSNLTLCIVKFLLLTGFYNIDRLNWIKLPITKPPNFRG